MGEELTYLRHLGVWAVPLLALQLAVIGWTSPRPGRVVARAVLVPVSVVTAWLVAADHLAISAGIWRFGAGKLVGVRLGAVPVEEALFFLATNLLVALGTVLLADLGARRAAT